MRAIAVGLCLALGACAGASALPATDQEIRTSHPSVAPDSLDSIAEGYVMLILRIGQIEEGYVDAYYGDPRYAQLAESEPRTAERLLEEARYLIARIDGLEANYPVALSAEEVQRRAYLRAHASAAEARLRMILGEKMSFADEAEALFGVRPELRPLESYEPILARIDALIPGDGDLTDRVNAFKAHFVIPPDRLQPVFDAAIAECRRRTVEHIALPANESFTMAFVHDKPWSGYNYYQGNAASRIEINQDLPIYSERAIDLGCHEGYPGHHVYNALLEQTFVREKGWIEMSVYPLFSPMSLIAEGSANYGIDLAFPGDEGPAFERSTLFPLAGLNPADVETKAELGRLTRQLASAEYTIADDFLSGRLDREQTVRRLMHYMLSSRERAEQRVRFIETYRSYIINYGLGRDMVQSWVERQGPDHWASMQQLLASQILPVDLE